MKIETNGQYCRGYIFLQEQQLKIAKYKKADFRVVDFYRRYNCILTKYYNKYKVKVMRKPTRTVGSDLGIRRKLGVEDALVRNKFSLKKFKQYQILTVTVKTNNVFCILTDQDNNCIVRACSPKKYGIKISRKTLKEGCIDFLRKYRKETKEKKIELSSNFVVRIKSPSQYRKVIYKQIKGLFLKQIFSKYFQRKSGFLKRKRREAKALEYKNKWRVKKGLLPLTVKEKEEVFEPYQFVFDFKQGVPFNGCRAVKMRCKKKFKPRTVPVR